MVAGAGGVKTGKDGGHDDENMLETPSELTGAETLAAGALAAGVQYVTGYPGAPATSVVEVLLEQAPDLTVEWAVNEKVALECALGASVGGWRSLVAVKSVGLNVAVDPLLTLNFTGINAGLVILLGDDPGAHVSQNEQDTRGLAYFAELPLLEPVTLDLGAEVMRTAFDLSESTSLPFILRVPWPFVQTTAEVKVPPPASAPLRPLSLAPFQWISTGYNAVANHVRLHARLADLEERFTASPWNQRWGQGLCGVVAVGFAAEKLRPASEEVPPLSVLALTTVHPLPRGLVLDFLSTVERVLVLEENDPWVERQIKALAQEAKLTLPIWGRESGHLPVGDELREENIRQALAWLLKGKTHPPPSPLRPPPDLYTFCQECPYIPTLEALREAIAAVGREVVVTGDPGCLIWAAAPPYELLHLKYCLGASINLAAGLARARPNCRAVALMGDSSFYHTGLPGLVNAANLQHCALLLILDNGATATTGFQPTPNVGRNARGRPSPSVKMEDLVAACGLTPVIVDPLDREHTRTVLQAALERDDLSVVIVRRPCPLLEAAARGEVRRPQYRPLQSPVGTVSQPALNPAAR